MSHNNHVMDGFNKDIGMMQREEALEYYMSLTDGWVPYNKPPTVTIHDGVRVVRDDLIAGTKARACDLLFSKITHDTIVYSQPRTGLAGVSMTSVAKHHNKNVVLFMPSSKQISLHQACCIERGAKVFFERIAAMPNLNLKAKTWAEKTGAFFVPLGLRHEYATAGIIHTALSIPEPDEVYVAISTGVLARALQIAWPNAKFTCVAVARNLKSGELGAASVISEPLDFTTPENVNNLPPFPTVPTYDGKVWKYIPKNSGKNVLMWNVGTDPVLNDQSIILNTNSYRDWNKNEISIGSPNREHFE